jgi:hypothetical protein
VYADKAYASAEHDKLLAKRNQTRFMLAAMAYNIKRGVAVQAEMMACTG